MLYLVDNMNFFLLDRINDTNSTFTYWCPYPLNCPLSGYLSAISITFKGRRSQCYPLYFHFWILISKVRLSKNTTAKFKAAICWWHNDVCFVSVYFKMSELVQLYGQGSQPCVRNMLLYCGLNRDQKPKLVPIPRYVSLTFLNTNLYIINMWLIMLYDSINTSDCIALLVVLIVEWQIENRLEGRNDGLIEALPLNMSGVTRKIHKPPWLR